MRVPGDRLERLVLLVDVPHRMVFHVAPHRMVVVVARHHPLVILLRLEEPLQELLRRLHVLAELPDPEAPRHTDGVPSGGTGR